MVSFHSLLTEDGYWFRWLGVPLVNTVWEIFTLWWAYVIPWVTFRLLQKTLRPSSGLQAHVLLGLANAGVWSFMAQGIFYLADHKPQYLQLWLIYTMVGGLFGGLFYQWLVRPVRMSASIN